MTTHANTAALGPFRTANGTYKDICADCGTVTVGTTPEDVDGASCACKAPRREYVYLVELVCMLCARRLGDATAARPDAPIFVRARLRCRHCGGLPWPSGQVRRLDVTKYPTFADLCPRRGRPSKRLQELRRPA